MSVKGNVWEGSADVKVVLESADVKMVLESWGRETEEYPGHL